MRESRHNEPTATQIACSLYRNLLWSKDDYDPRLWPLGLLEWEELPSISKQVLTEAVLAMQKELY